LVSERKSIEEYIVQKLPACNLSIVRMNVKLLDAMGRLGPLGLVGAELHPYCTDALKVRLALLEVLLKAGLVLNAGDGGGAEAVRCSDKPSPENHIILYKREKYVSF
jgi:hypothetical protein